MPKVLFTGKYPCRFLCHLLPPWSPTMEEMYSSVERKEIVRLVEDEKIENHLWGKLFDMGGMGWTDGRMILFPVCYSVSPCSSISPIFNLFVILNLGPGAPWDILPPLLLMFTLKLAPFLSGKDGNGSRKALYTMVSKVEDTLSMARCLWQKGRKMTTVQLFFLLRRTHGKICKGINWGRILFHD